MAESWRIDVQLNNQSGIVQASTSSVGATVIKAPKGPTIPIKIYKGEEKRILNIFGNPTSTYPGIWEAIQYNKEADLWISAPVSATGSLYGGVLVRTGGTEELVSGQASTDLTYTAIEYSETVGTGDGSTTNFTTTLTDFADYVNQTVDLSVDGTSINVTASDAPTEVLTTSPNVGSGTYVRATGALSFNFSSAPTTGQIITVTYTVNVASDALFAIFTKNKQADDLYVQNSYSSTTGLWSMQAWIKEYDGTYTELPASPYTFSLTENTKDGFGKDVYIGKVLENDDFFTFDIYTATVASFSNDSAKVALNGGDRGSAITLTELTTGWNYFQKRATYPAQVFFDTTADAGIPALFNTLRNTYQKYSDYLLPTPNADSTTTISTVQGYSINNRGLAFYWNWGKVRNRYAGGTNFYTTLMGKVAAKWAAMANVYNGLAPSWIDENGHGGQLGGDILELAYDPTESQLEALDTAGINGIVYYPQYGYMISSQKTATTTLSDYSYILHSRLADYIISNIVNLVLPPQLTKLNDVTHRAKVRTLADSIVSPLVGGTNNFVSDYIVKCDADNNDASILAQRKFVLDVGVKFTPTSETIVFRFTNVEQGTDVQTLFNNQ